MVAVAAVLLSKSRSNAANSRVKLGGLALARGRSLEGSGKIYRARPWLLLANVLSTYDLARAIATSRVRSYIEGFSLIFGLVASLVLSKMVGWEAWIVFIIGSIMSGFGLMIEVWDMRREDAGCDIIDLAGDPGRSRDLRTTVASKASILGFKSSSALYDQETNRELSRQSTPENATTFISWSEDHHPLPPKVQDGCVFLRGRLFLGFPVMR